MVSTWTEIDGLKMHARVSALGAVEKSSAIVLVHGLGVSSCYMEPIANRLAADHAVFVPDLPGFGKSDKPSHILNLQELADSIASWMRAVGLERAVLLGNSLGCQVIVHFALRYPDAIERAILVGATIDPRARSLIRQVGRGLLDLLGEPWSLLPILLSDYLKAGPLRVVRTLEYALNDPVEEMLLQVPVPTLVIRGAHDPISTQRWAEQMVRLLPCGQLAVLPGAAHAANFGDSEELAEVVRSFLRVGI